MRNKYKIEFLVFCLFLLFGSVTAQTYNETINTIFEHVDKSKIATGLLSDYGIQMVDIESFNGIPTDSNYVDIETWKKLYNGLYSSKINSNANLSSPDVVLAGVENAQPTNNAVPVAMMQFQYDKLNDDAANLGLLQIVNNQIYEVAGAASPYFTKQLFAVAPKSIVFNSLSASFVFNSSLWFTNSGKTVQKIEVNFNDESGYLTTSWDASILYTFTTDGTKTIFFRLTYTDGTNYTSRTKVVMHGSSMQKAPIDVTRFEEYPISATIEHSGGKLQIYYATSNNTSPRKFRKTLIVAEGFDPSSVMGTRDMDIRDFIYWNTGGIDVDFYNPSLGYYTSLLDGLNINDYDIVYVDNTDGVDDIRRNAKLFEYAIDHVNSNKDGDYENVVMGISMGGLVARYALRKMEIAGKDHKACKYISVDSPHKGANVPVGAQALIRHVENIDFNLFWFFTVYNATQIDNNIGAAVKLLNSKGTKQLLIYNVTKNFTYDNSDHDTFMAEYESLGVPQKCQNIAVANGSNNGTKFFEPQTELININETVGLKWWQEILNVVLGQLSYTTLLTNYPQLSINAIPGKTELAASIVSNALPDRSVQNVYDGRIFLKKKILWLIPVEVDITHKTLKSTSDMLPVDGASGGSYDVSKFGVGGSYAKYLKKTSFCFIPTVSAIGLSNWKDRLTTPLNNTNFYAYGLSPFRYYFAQSDNEYHTQFDSPASFLYDHFISNCVIPDELEDDIYIQNLTISSDRYFRGKNIYIGNNVTTNVPQGNVLINNGAKVIFDGKTVVFDKGFECAGGSVSETVKH